MEFVGVDGEELDADDPDGEDNPGSLSRTGLNLFLMQPPSPPTGLPCVPTMFADIRESGLFLWWVIFRRRVGNGSEFEAEPIPGVIAVNSSSGCMATSTLSSSWRLGKEKKKLSSIWRGWKENLDPGGGKNGFEVFPPILNCGLDPEGGFLVTSWGNEAEWGRKNCFLTSFPEEGTGDNEWAELFLASTPGLGPWGLLKLLLINRWGSVCGTRVE